ncbi:CdaR family transcriptional regulator [Lachnotalea glycerini]|nr:CdaR family transcriptional regulator [Lachnotalea glycerini]
MTFTKLVEKISKEYSIDILSVGTDMEIHDVALIDNKHDNSYKNTLYFGYDRQLKNLAFLPSQCILAKTPDMNLTNFSLTNIALVTEDNLFTVINEAKAFIEATRSKGIFEELTALADKTHCLEAVINTASVRLGNSLLFCDMNYKILAYSTTIPVLDPLWVENTKKGYCSYEFISSVKELKSIKSASSTTAAFEVTCPQSPYQKLSSKVFHNQTQIGFLLMIESENNILPSHYEMMSTISHVISYTIAYYTPDLFEGNSQYHELLYDMLIGAPSKDILPRLTELPFPPKMLVLFIRPTRYMGPQYLKNFTYKNLKVQIQGTHATYHNKGIVAVIPLKEDAEMELELLNMLKDICQKEHIRIGISNSFTNIENFVDYYEQAHAALELGQKLKTEELICRYQDYQIYDLFSELKNPDKLGHFCHPALAILRQYDHKSSSELYKTLCVFIDKGCHINLTSESLSIPRNSLVYRLNRITDICQIDFSDINTLFLLRLSFLIDRYNELNTSKEWQ